MCGRFSLSTTAASIQEHFSLPNIPVLTPRYNIAPSQNVAVVRQSPETKQRELVKMRWGLIPPWAKDMKIGYSLINARAETVDEKPSFRPAFQKRRCLIVADGFYEWSHEQKKKQPFYIRMNDASLFGFAGLWETWSDPGGSIIESCTILTTAANELISKIHDRMPVIMLQKNYDLWLSPDAKPSETRKLLQSIASAELTSYPISALVNNPKNDDPACIRKVLA